MVIRQQINDAITYGFHIIQKAFDSLGRLMATKDGNGNVTKFVYDANGNLAEELHADGGRVVYTYDNCKRLIPFNITPPIHVIQLRRQLLRPY